MALIHHLALAEEWVAAKDAGTYTMSTLGLELADEGFIHCSRAEQVDKVFGSFYAAATEPILLLTIDTELLTSSWQYDDVPGEPLSFPHIYGPLNVDAVVQVREFRPSTAT